MALVESVGPRVSYSDLCQQPEDGRRYEIYDGEVFVVPSPLPLHQIVAMNIEDWVPLEVQDVRLHNVVRCLEILKGSWETCSARRSERRSSGPTCATADG